MNGSHHDLCASWPQSVFDAMRAQRRDAAMAEAGDDCRPVRKSHQRTVKAVTILLNHFDGKPVSFPAELEIDMMIVMAKATEHVMVQ